MIKNPTNVGMKKANRNKVFAFGNLNFNNALLINLKVNVMNTANRIGINKNN